MIGRSRQADVAVRSAQCAPDPAGRRCERKGRPRGRSSSTSGGPQQHLRLSFSVTTKRAGAAAAIILGASSYSGVGVAGYEHKRSAVGLEAGKKQRRRSKRFYQPGLGTSDDGRTREAGPDTLHRQQRILDRRSNARKGPVPVAVLEGSPAPPQQNSTGQAGTFAGGYGPAPTRTARRCRTDEAYAFFFWPPAGYGNATDADYIPLWTAAYSIRATELCHRDIILMRPQLDMDMGTDTSGQQTNTTWPKASIARKMAALGIEARDMPAFRLGEACRMAIAACEWFQGSEKFMLKGKEIARSAIHKANGFRLLEYRAVLLLDTDILVQRDLGWLFAQFTGGSSPGGRSDTALQQDLEIAGRVPDVAVTGDEQRAESESCAAISKAASGKTGYPFNVGVMMIRPGNSELLQRYDAILKSSNKTIGDQWCWKAEQGLFNRLVYDMYFNNDDMYFNTSRSDAHRGGGSATVPVHQEGTDALTTRNGWTTFPGTEGRVACFEPKQFGCRWTSETSRNCASASVQHFIGADKPWDKPAPPDDESGGGATDAGAWHQAKAAMDEFLAHALSSDTDTNAEAWHTSGAAPQRSKTL